jgi:hypothetical protein
LAHERFAIGNSLCLEVCRRVTNPSLPCVMVKAIE